MIPRISIVVGRRLLYDDAAEGRHLQIGVALVRQVADGVPQAERTLAVSVELLDLRCRLQDGVQNFALRSAAGERLRERRQGETAANFRKVGSDGRKRRLGHSAQEIKHAEAEPTDEGLQNEIGEAVARHDRGDGLLALPTRSRRRPPSPAPNCRHR